MAYVWTGQYLFIWGGYDAITPSSAHAAGDGALYDPRARSWRRLPAGPLPAESSAQAVWTGSEVVLLGGQTTGPGGGLSSAVAAYVPATNTWRSLPPIPQSVSGNAASLTAVAAGSEIYVWEEWAHFQQNGNESTTTSGLEPIRYDQASNQWRTQPTTGTGPPFVVPQALWTGTEILVPATYQCPFGASCPASGGNSFVGYRWSPATTAWATIPHGPVDGLHAGSLWTGAALLDYNSTDTGGPDNSVEGEAAAWDPASNAWTRLPNAPYAGGLVAVWTGDRLLMWGEMAPPRPNAAATSGPYQAVGLQFGP